MLGHLVRYKLWVSSKNTNGLQSEAEQAALLPGRSETVLNQTSLSDWGFQPNAMKWIYLYKYIVMVWDCNVLSLRSAMWHKKICNRKFMVASDETQTEWAAGRAPAMLVHGISAHTDWTLDTHCEDRIQGTVTHAWCKMQNRSSMVTPEFPQT